MVRVEVEAAEIVEGESGLLPQDMHCSGRGRISMAGPRGVVGS